MDDSMSDKKRPAVKFFAALICIVMVSSMTMNCAISRQPANFFPDTISSETIDNQPLMQYYSSMAVVPLNMVSKLISAMATGIKPPVKSKSRGAEGNGALNSGFSFVIPGNIAGAMKLQSNAIFMHYILQSGTPANHSDYRLQLLMTGFGPCILFMYLMLFLITLRRRSLPAPCINKIYFLKTQS
jgi:hypothetical protein